MDKICYQGSERLYKELRGFKNKRYRFTSTDAVKILELLDFKVRSSGAHLICYSDKLRDLKHPEYDSGALVLGAHYGGKKSMSPKAYDDVRKVLKALDIKY